MSSISGAQYEADLPADARGQIAGHQRSQQQEIDLLERARHGDRSAYGKIVELLQDRLFNAMLRMVGDHEEARELTQESFTRGLEKIDSFRGDSSAYTWLFRIAMNLAISNLRKINRHRSFSLYGETSPDAQGGGHDVQTAGLLDRFSQHREESPAAAAERSERQQAVVQALGRLDAECRAVLVMRDIEGCDYQQMADVLGLPLGTLKSRLFRARLALRDELCKFMAEYRRKPGDMK